jgi:hypothetical protein
LLLRGDYVIEEIDSIRKKLDDFSGVCRSIAVRIAVISEEIKKCDWAVMDIEHYLELHNFDAATGYKLARKIKELRVRRRELKDELEPLLPLNSFIERHKPIWNELDKTRGAVKKENSRVNGCRTYKPRILSDLWAGGGQQHE